MKTLLTIIISSILFAVSMTPPAKRELVKLTLYFAHEAALEQQGGGLSLGRLNRELNGNAR